MEVSGGVAKSNQTLSSAHPGTGGIESPCNPVGGSHSSVPVCDVDGVVGGMVVPVQERVKHGEGYACGKNVVGVELVR